jgi:DNA ligase 1
MQPNRRHFNCLAALFGVGWLASRTTGARFAGAGVAGAGLAGIGLGGISQAASAKANAPALLLAMELRGEVDVSRYLVSEKLDGVRAYWTGAQLLTRGGQVIAAPAWFTQPLPKEPLDGELWMGRGQFEQTSGAVRTQVPGEAQWRKITYQLFEKPHEKGVFKDRAAAIQRLVDTLNVPHVKAIKQERVENQAALMAMLKRVTSAGAEGLMLHLADAPYVTGRHAALLKLKPLFDAEATVIGHEPGKGKYEGLLGALRVRTPEGVIFKIGTGLTDEARRNPPPVGSTITYQYRDRTAGGKPRFASFLRMAERAPGSKR